MPKGKFLGTTHLSRALCSVRISVTAMAQGRSWYQGQTRMFCLQEAWAELQRFLHIVDTPSQPGAGESGQVEKIWFWEGISAAGRRMLQGKREGRKGSHSCSHTWDSILTVNSRSMHDVGIQREKASWKSTQSQAPEPWVPGDSLCVTAQGTWLLQHLSPLVSWAVLCCSSLTCFINCRLWSLASLWFTMGKG